MSLKNLNVSKKTHKFLLDKLKDRRIFQIYKKFEGNFPIKKKFIVAVSGGPDSLALSFLAKIYSIKKSVDIKYYIVDHRLRKNSTLEAKLVQKKLKNFSVKLNILTWKGKKPRKNIQSVAREKRYELLTNVAKKYGIQNILLGHHLDDLFENFFLSNPSRLNFFIKFLIFTLLKFSFSFDGSSIYVPKILLLIYIKSFLSNLIKGLIKQTSFLTASLSKEINPLRPLPLKILIKKFSNKSSK